MSAKGKKDLAGTAAIGGGFNRSPTTQSHSFGRQSGFLGKSAIENPDPK
jgi:hypothetical protein